MAKQFNRSYKHKHDTNPDKLIHINKIRDEYRRIAKIIIDKQIINFWKTGNIDPSNKLYQTIETFLSERYKDVIKRQIDGMMKTWMKNAKNRLVKILYKTFPKEEAKKMLKQDWFRHENLLVRKIFKHVMGNFPTVKNINLQLNTKVFTLEKSTDSIYTYWIRLCTGVRGKYIYIPLLENTYYEKNKDGKLTNSIRLDFKENKLVNVVFCHEKEPEPVKYDKEKLAIDIGLKNLITTSEGDMFGQKFYTKLKWFDDKIQDLQKELKRRSIELSKHKKWKKLNQRLKDYIKNEINRIINRMFEIYKFKELVVENLDFQGSKLSKTTNRLLNKFGLGAITKKLEALEEEKEVKINYVNPAYTSQQCDICGYVDSHNRVGEAFECKCCEHKCHADLNSPKIVNRRSEDKRIGIYTKKEEIIRLLIEDFVHGKWFRISCLSSAWLLRNKYHNIYSEAAQSFFSMK